MRDRWDEDAAYWGLTAYQEWGYRRRLVRLFVREAERSARRANRWMRVATAAGSTGVLGMLVVAASITGILARAC